MKTLYDPPVTAEVQQRLATLTASRPPLWGRMNAGQAMAHCAIALESATGDRPIKRVFIGRIFGRLVKRLALSDDQPLKRNTPTARELLVTDDRDFGIEQLRLSSLIDRFGKGGRTGCTTKPHAFFGPMTPDEWGVLMYKHLDHHLRQFGV